MWAMLTSSASRSRVRLLAGFFSHPKRPRIQVSCSACNLTASCCTAPNSKQVPAARTFRPAHAGYCGRVGTTEGLADKRSSNTLHSWSAPHEASSTWVRYRICIAGSVSELNSAVLACVDGRGNIGVLQVDALRLRPLSALNERHVLCRGIAGIVVHHPARLPRHWHRLQGVLQ